MQPPIEEDGAGERRGAGFAASAGQIIPMTVSAVLLVKLLSTRCLRLGEHAVPDVLVRVLGHRVRTERDARGCKHSEERAAPSICHRTIIATKREAPLELQTSN